MYEERHDKALKGRSYRLEGGIEDEVEVHTLSNIALKQIKQSISDYLCL